MPPVLLTQSQVEALNAEFGFVADSVGDPGPGMYFDQQLTALYPELLKLEVEDIWYKDFIPTVPYDPGAEEIEVRFYELTGHAKWISSYSDDVPMVNVASRSVKYKVKDFANGYEYSDKEIEKAYFAASNGRGPTVSLSRELPEAALRAHEEFLESVAWTGDESVGIHGLFTYPGMARMALATSIGSSVTAIDMAQALIDAFNAQVDLTKQKNPPTVALCSTTIYNHINSRMMTSSIEKSVKQYVEEKTGLTFRKCPKCNGAGYGGTTDVIFLYTPNKKKMHLALNQFFKQKPPQAQNFAWKILCRSTTGGIVCNFPLEHTIIEVTLV